MPCKISGRRGRPKTGRLPRCLRPQSRQPFFVPSAWPLLPRTDLPADLRLSVTVVAGGRRAQHMPCALRLPAPAFRRPSQRAKTLPGSAPLPCPSAVQARVACAPCPSPGCRSRHQEKSGFPRRYGEISPCKLFLLRAIPVRMRVWQMFFVKKITNKSSHLYRIFRPQAADGANFRILLIPAAPPYA